MAKANSAFMKPLKLTPELEAVVGAGPLPRSEVVKKLWVYIKAKDLQDPKNKRDIVADKKLSKLLGYDSATAEDPLTYFRIQTYMKKHFTNPPSEEK